MGAPLPISSLIVEDWFNGLYSALMLTTMWIILSNKKRTAQQKLRSSAWVIIPYICSTMHASLNWSYYAKAVDDNELPTGPGLLYALTHLDAWVEGTGDAFFCLNILLADCLFIWRCWIIWDRRWLVVLLPIMATITGAVLAGIIISDQVIALSTKEAFTMIKKSAEFVTLSAAYFSLSVATSLTTTLLIALRILIVQNASNKVQKNTFNPVLEILIESAALYSFTLLIFVVLLIRKNSNVYYAQNIHAQMAGIAPLLISLRVAAGHSRPRDEWSSTSSRATTIRFVQSGSTLEGSDVHGQTTTNNGGDPRVVKEV